MNYIIYKQEPYSNHPSYHYLERVLQFYKGKWITNLYSKVTGKHFQHRYFEKEEDSLKDFDNRKLEVTTL